MPVLTVDGIRERVNCPDVRCERSGEGLFTSILIVPEKRRPKLDPIYWVCDETADFVQEFGFSGWHCHPEMTAPSGIEESISIARRLVAQELCVVIERDGRGKTRPTSGSLCEVNDVPDRISDDASDLVRVFFGRRPTPEKIDYRRYFRDGTDCLERDFKEAMDARSEEIQRLIGELRSKSS